MAFHFEVLGLVDGHPASFDGEISGMSVRDERVLGWRRGAPGLLTVCGEKEPPGLEDTAVRWVSVGEGHAAVVACSGELSCFGSNEFGQCGAEGHELQVSAAKRVSGLRRETFIRVFCGPQFTMALAKSGNVFGFGLNSFGQLGIDPKEPIVTIPRRVGSLFGIPIVDIACGDSHCLGLSAHGAVFSWGRNKYGELGLGHNRQEFLPQAVTALNGIRIISVNCGLAHSVVVSSQGKIYTFGHNSFGQCGAGNKDNQPRPFRAQIGDLVNLDKIIKVSCGNFHTVCLVEDLKTLYVFGRNDNGQCGLSSKSESILTPKKILLDIKEGEFVHDVVSGAFFTLITLGKSVSESSSDMDVDTLTKSQQADAVQIICSPIDSSGCSALPFNELYHVDRNGIKEGIAAAKESNDFGPLIHLLSRTFSSVACLNSSFLSVQNEDMFEFLSSGIDISSVRPAFDDLLSLSIPEMSNRLSKAISHLLEDVRSHQFTVQHPCFYRFLLILYENPQLVNPGYSRHILLNMNRILTSIASYTSKTVIHWISLYPEDQFKRIIHNLNECIDFGFESSGALDGYVISSILALEVFYEANSSRSSPIPLEFFRNATLSRSKNIDLSRHYLSWVQEKDKCISGEFSLCKYPFILDSVAKQEILRVEAIIQMDVEAKKAIFSQIGFQPPNPYFILPIHRSMIRHDTLNIIHAVLKTNPSVLKRPMKVSFIGEEGVDEGGVKKEFFQLVVKDIFNEDYGMFTYNSETCTFWFNPHSFESSEEFQLIGIIIGLAIYNQINLDVHFPLVVYKKLLHQKISLADVREFDPQLYINLRKLLDFEGDVESIFCLDFSFSYDYFGEVKVVDLKPNGRNIPVTNDNRLEYVERYLEHKFVDSVKLQFEPFDLGFSVVARGPALHLFRDSELEMLVCGSPFLDFEALEAKTTYSGGFDAQSPIIQWFWKIVHEMDHGQKKQLLFFVTGSNRAPLRGLGQLPFVIQNAGVATNQLPTAHTCFNTLLIPRYGSFDELKRKLLIAIQNSEGFGFQ